MDVQVKHSGTDISHHVIRYDREHKVCTGIGMIEVEVDYTYSGTFDPWDSIDVYENGVHAAKYYVSSVSEGQPSATVVVTAQDNSKRLSDYFITDTYLIDYPSYSRYWIETFLHEVGISYSFLTTSNGVILSNNTSLGLMSAYEQILMLLQMSGWYIRFNSSGRAIIGKLDIDSAKNKGSLGNTDIIEIKVSKNDRMYRNRVVIWGNGDPATNRWVFADVRKPTKWDYDSRDLRTILISNSNIPTVADAFMLANQALTEFARLNVEKYLTVEDARNISVGDVVSIRTKVYSGKAMVTTFGVSMSKAGLVSNIACDERCPRLFGFFNPGGYVYVGTFGSGVWRKHILDYARNGVPSGTVLSGLATDVYSGGWFDYSSGLQDMNVTDLHVNNAVLACVTSSGQIYYSLEDETPWSGIVLSGLQVTYSGTLLESTVYSGIMGRACIIDRDTNFLRYAVDTASGENLGDFLMETDPLTSIGGTMFWYTDPSGMIISSGTMSGVLPSGRGWVIDANPYDGTVTNTFPVWVSGGSTTVSGLIPGTTISGNYNFTLLDIENDGTNDYVSALTYGSGSIPQTLILGTYNSDIGHSSNDVESFAFFGFNGGMEKDNFYTFINYSGYPIPALQNNTTYGTTSISTLQGGFGLYVESNTKAYSQYSESASSKRRVVVRRFDSTAVTTELASSKSSAYDFAKTFPLATRRISTNVFRYYFRKSAINNTLGTDLLIIDLTITNTSTGASTITETVISNCLRDLTGTYANTRVQTVVRGTTLYTARVKENGVGEAGDLTIELYKTNLETGSEEQRNILQKVHLGTWNDDAAEIYTPGSFLLAPYGTDSMELVVAYNFYKSIQPANVGIYKARRYRQRGFSGIGIDEELYDWMAEFGTYNQGGDTPEIPRNNLSALGPMTRNRNYRTYTIKTTDPDKTVSFDDFYDTTATPSVFPGAQYTTAYDTEAIGDMGGSVFKIFNPADGTEISTVTVPANYEINNFCGMDSFNRDLIFHATNTDLSTYEIIWVTRSGVVTRRQASSLGDSNCRVIGTFRVTLTPPFPGPTATIKWIKPIETPGYFPIYMVLQRDGWDYGVVKSGIYQDRLDISNYSPLVTMDRRISSLETYFISTAGEVTTTSNVAMSGHNLGPEAASGQVFSLGILADDFRYSDFEDTVESGTSRRLFVVYSGSVGSIDLWTLDSFSGEFLSPSGGATRIEISNYSLPDQYVFVSVSGYTASGGFGFFQKSPAASGYDMASSGVFVDYSSGYPQARTTIIRLDDSL